jgi:hypothetical protein
VVVAWWLQVFPKFFDLYPVLTITTSAILVFTGRVGRARAARPDA